MNYEVTSNDQKEKKNDFTIIRYRLSIRWKQLQAVIQRHMEMKMYKTSCNIMGGSWRGIRSNVSWWWVGQWFHKSGYSSLLERGVPVDLLGILDYNIPGLIYNSFIYSDIYRTNHLNSNTITHFILYTKRMNISLGIKTSFASYPENTNLYEEIQQQFHMWKP